MKQHSTIHFWGIGAQKAGTSWLFHYLSKIPEFDIPPFKELHYFDRSPEYPSPSRLSRTKLSERLTKKLYLKKAYWAISRALGKGDFRSVKFYFKWFFSNYSDEWYLSLFDQYKGITGEITPSYSMLKKEDIAKMYAMSPNAKLILMVRNPVDRAWSHYRHTKRAEKNFQLENESPEDIINFFESDDQSLRSDYMRTLENYSHVFPKEQILIGFYDAIIEDPSGLLLGITKFFGVDSIPEIESKVVHKSIEVDCPDEVYEYLKQKYFLQIKGLADKYGGYFSKWHHDLYGSDESLLTAELSPTLRLA